MKTNLLACAVIAIVCSGGCARSPQPASAETAAPSPVVGAVRIPAPAVASALPLLVVTKNASCGCCRLWVEHMRQAGFMVEVHDVDNLDPIKTRVGVPVGKGSCHTAEVGGYFIEGHVPAADVKRLLVEKPAAKGLVAPGMPLGSPGMEVPDGATQHYTVELVHNDGTTTPFAEHGP
jgi:hypothetical protein